MLYDLVKAAVKDSSGKLDDPTDYDNAITAALKRYSTHRPRLIVEDIAGQDGPDIPLPTEWSEGLSLIRDIEYPVGYVPSSMIDARDWRFYRTPSDCFIRFTDGSPAADETVRVTHTAVHADESTVAATDLEAVANLAASICCRILAAQYGNTSDPTIQADSVNYRSKTDEYRRLADSFEQLYNQQLGIRTADSTPAAMATAAPPDSTRTRLTHGRK